MGPLSAPSDASSAPLADHFFIAGIESSRVLVSRSDRHSNGAAVSTTLDTTLEEDSQGEDATPRDTAAAAAAAAARPPRPGTGDTSASPNGGKRRSNRFSWEARKSIGSVIGLEPTKTSASNRSSATLRQSDVSRDPEEQEFAAALRKFAAERDSVLEEISFSAGQTPQPNRPRPKARTQRIRSDGDDKGSIRRRISTLNPLSRSNTATRKGSVRQSRRLSGYNSVIPAPQRFSRSDTVHPLKRPYEPALLDRYPPKDMAEEYKRRQPFPDYVPMFVFPNDINVVSSDVRPKSTWHGFAMTNGDGSKLYGITLILWIPLAEEAAEDLETQCEEWRKRNMSPEERELANSLGERLASERSRLSELLAELREGSFTPDEYEDKQEQLSVVEEKIQLMSDMLKPVRHGAASKIEGLTDGDSGMWIPRAYGILGRDPGMTPFWKEWLRAVATPMASGSILGVPPSSPRAGFWQPLERYVVNLCVEAPSPTSSMTQVELSLRELRLHARKEAINEIPGSRNTDLYALFRSLQIPDVVVLLEYVLSESRIILLSSHTSMLHLACRAITQLMYPLEWAGVFIPVLPARLIQALEAPCPYIVGIERRYEHVELPEDDFVLVDLDNGIIEATSPPMSLPRQQRRKLSSILGLAAPHQYRYGVPKGPPAYATDTYPNQMFGSENSAVYDPSTVPSNMSYLAHLNSTSFGNGAISSSNRTPILNVFLQSRRHSSNSMDRPGTASTMRSSTSPPSPNGPLSPHPYNGMGNPLSRENSSNALQASLREKRSGHFMEPPKRTSSFGLDKVTHRRPSNTNHAPNLSVSTLGAESHGSASAYAPSVYAQSTLAASTVMPQVLTQPVHSTETTQWVEGHCMQWRGHDDRTNCGACDEKAEDGIFRCSGCGITAHSRCLNSIYLVCPSAFHPDQIIAAFVRCFASLFYTYRKHMTVANREAKKAGKHYNFNMDAFIKSQPGDSIDYFNMLRETQAFHAFIDDRERKPAHDPTVRLFDEIILAKRNRGKSSLFSKSQVNFLADRSDHLWQTASANSPSSRHLPSATESLVGRAPAHLDPALLVEPRVQQGVLRVGAGAKIPHRRKPVPSVIDPQLTLDTSAASSP